MCAHPATGQERVDDEQSGKDQDKLVADLEFLEISQRHIEQDRGGNHQHDMGQRRRERHQVFIAQEPAE